MEETSWKILEGHEQESRKAYLSKVRRQHEIQGCDGFYGGSHLHVCWERAFYLVAWLFLSIGVLFEGVLLKRALFQSLH